MFQDGSHPGSTVVDIQRGKHLIFLQMGASCASFAGTYMIERSLHTEAVGKYLIENSPVDVSGMPPVDDTDTLEEPKAETPDE